MVHDLSSTQRATGRGAKLAEEITNCITKARHQGSRIGGCTNNSAHVSQCIFHQTSTTRRPETSSSWPSWIQPRHRHPPMAQRAPPSGCRSCASSAAPPRQPPYLVQYDPQLEEHVQHLSQPILPRPTPRRPRPVFFGRCRLLGLSDQTRQLTKLGRRQRCYGPHGRIVRGSEHELWNHVELQLFVAQRHVDLEEVD